MKQLKIYVAGPYTNSDPEKRSENIKKAMEIGSKIMLLGHHPYVPHTHTGKWEDSANIDYEAFMQLHFTILEKWADALFFIGSSPGADREKEMAERLGMPVFTSIEEFSAFSSKNL